MKIKCPICKGKGVLEEPSPYKKNVKKTINNKIMTKLLKKEGYSVRQIMKFLGYKSPNSIQRYFNKG